MKTRIAGAALTLAVLIAVGGGCGSDGLAPPPPPPDSVSVFPFFNETLDSQMAQIGVNGGVGIDGGSDWHFEGGGIDGTRFAVGSTVLLHLHSRFYERLDTSFVAEGFPVIWVHRLVPKVLRAQWSADFTGATIRVQVYAPHGLPGVTITSAWVGYGACWWASPICYPYIARSASLVGPWHPDSTGWVQLTGRWGLWPDGLPPEGYGTPSGEHVWETSVGVHIEDDLGHKGRGNCGGAYLPGPPVEMRSCGTIFQQ